MRFKKLAVPTGDPAMPWTAIYNTMRGLTLEGHKEGVELDVEVIDQDEPGCYYAWLETDGMLKYVRPSGTQVLAVLGFVRAVDSTLGHLVRVRLTVAHRSSSSDTAKAPPAESPATGGNTYASAVLRAIRLAA